MKVRTEVDVLTAEVSLTTQLATASLAQAVVNIYMSLPDKLLPRYHEEDCRIHAWNISSVLVQMYVEMAKGHSSSKEAVALHGALCKEGLSFTVCILSALSTSDFMQ